MKVLVVEPMKKCYTKEINGLEEMQALVGGYIQAIYPFPDKAAVVCNEEGKNPGPAVQSPADSMKMICPTISSAAHFLWRV